MATSSTKKTTHAHDGDNVVQLRNMHGINQEELAKKLDISTEGMDKLEKAAHIPDPILARIAKALEVPFDWLRNFEETRNVYFTNGAISVYDNATNNVNFRPIFYIQQPAKGQNPYANSLNENDNPHGAKKKSAPKRPSRNK